MTMEMSVAAWIHRKNIRCFAMLALLDGLLFAACKFALPPAILFVVGCVAAKHCAIRGAAFEFHDKELAMVPA